MLLEKAYAKLHGCYESLLHGLLEKSFYDLTASANVRVLRKELLNPESKCSSCYHFLFFYLVVCLFAFFIS